MLRSIDSWELLYVGSEKEHLHLNWFRLGFEGGEIDLEGGAQAQLAFHFHPAVVLFDNAKNCRQAEAGAFADVFGGEEGLEDVGEVFRRNAGAGIRNADPGKLSNAIFPIGLASGAIEFNLLSGDAQATAERHGIAGIDGQVHDHLVYHAGIGQD